MATPFRADGSLDREGAARLAEHLVETGTETVLLNGTTGESPVLSHEEKFQLLDTVIEAVGKEVPVMMGTGTYSTAESVALTREAEAHGADSILLVVPYYNKPPQDGLFWHFSTIADETTLPVMLYNIPSRTVTDLQPKTIIRLAEIPNIFAVKEASGVVTRTAEILALAPPDFRVYAGDDATALPIMSLGGYGVVSVLGNIAGQQLRSMIDAVVDGKREDAAARYAALLPLLEALFVTVNPIPLKAALKMLDLPGGSPRLPLIDATPAEEAIVKKALQAVKLLG